MGGIGSGRQETGEKVRTETIIFKVFPEEKLRIKANAFMSKKRISQYVRELVLKEENLTLSVQNEKLKQLLSHIEETRINCEENLEKISTIEKEIRGILKDSGIR